MLALVCVVVACRGNAASDGGAPDASSAAPAGFGLSTLVELRDSSDEEGKTHDLVLRFEREGHDFAWVAKVAGRDASLGERLPDPFLQQVGKACACAIDDVCACERTGSNAPEQRKGRVAATFVDALLAACAAEVVAPVGADAARPYAGKPRRHLSTWASAVGDTHFSSTLGDPKWRANGQAVASGGAAIDDAFDRLLAEVGAPAWVTALNASARARPKEGQTDVDAAVAPMTLPAGFSALAKAQVLEVNDQWSGMGPAHQVLLRLVRKGGQFAWTAKLVENSGSLRDPDPDPYSPPERDPPTGGCVTEKGEECPPREPRDVTKKSGTVAAAPVEAFLAAVATHGIDPAYKPTPGHWSDDSPKGHVVVWSAAGAVPVHLSFLNQQRRWRVNGRELTLDAEDSAPKGPEAPYWSHVKLNAAYQAMLTAIGLDRWIRQLPANARWK